MQFHEPTSHRRDPRLDMQISSVLQELSLVDPAGFNAIMAQVGDSNLEAIIQHVSC